MRTYRPERIRSALLAQARGVGEAVRALPAGTLGAPTRVGWSVAELVAHVARQVEAMGDVLGEPAPRGKAGLTPARWAGLTAGIADRLAEDTEEAVARTPDVVGRLTAAVAGLETALADGMPDRGVRITLGTMTAVDFAVTRLVELVVHADDLAAATGAAVPVEREALAGAVRLLADALAEQVPGNAVELRVPPFAAVQCVPGPRHTRGTPPNVVETDPLTWLRLACGRLSWQTALSGGTLSASGDRADISSHLPVLG